MNLSERIKVLAGLGNEIDRFLADTENHQWKDLVIQAKVLNPWFTKENVLDSFRGVRQFLHEEALTDWLKNYQLKEDSKRVGVIMAGNIPMVGFHDLLCVFISGNHFVGKLSSDDQLLMQNLVKKMVELDSRVADRIEFVERLKENFDAVIATGSNNSARYFEYYFGKFPNIIRRNRNAVAVLSGNETKEELNELGKDIFTHFGLGCRNVSKLFLPNGYNIDNFYEGIFDYGNVIEHNKYNNNYSYNRTVYLMQEAKFFDNNFLLLKEDKAMASPIGSLYFETFSDIDSLKGRLSDEDENIQCVVSTISDLHSRQVGFGDAQQPKIDDYADGVDTMEFLFGLT